MTLLTFILFSAKGQVTEYYIVGKIEISGNKTTREKTILREIEFRQGDTIPANELEAVLKKNHNNLMNMSLFHFAEIQYTVDSTHLAETPYINIFVHIQLTERLYIWPLPIVYLEERNFNEWLEHKDLSRLNWGMVLIHENFRGRREQISAGFKTGFNDMVMLKYSNPAIDKNQSLGLSVSFNYAREHNIFYKTENNIRSIVKLDNEFAITNTFVHAAFTKRKGIHETFRIYGQYNHYTFSDTLLSLNPQFVDPSEGILQFFTLSLLYKYDFRDYIHYPLEGYYFDCELTKQGLGIMKNEDFSATHLKTSIRQYRKIDHRVYFAAGFTARFRLDGNTSYYFTRGLGFGNEYVRGFESYVIDGQNYYILKSNLKYNLVRQRILKLEGIRTEKFNTIPYRFYINAFADAGYIKDMHTANNNPLGNKLLFGYGVGLDFVTYYDRAYRFEISRNSKNEISFAIQFTAPI
jgi:outer membrane protein assembly factor BamA